MGVKGLNPKGVLLNWLKMSKEVGKVLHLMIHLSHLMNKFLLYIGYLLMNYIYKKKLCLKLV